MVKGKGFEQNRSGFKIWLQCSLAVGLVIVYKFFYVSHLLLYLEKREINNKSNPFLEML